VSKRLRAAAEGSFLARLGGDEFTLVSTGVPQPSGAAALADRLQAALAGETYIEGRRLRTGLSIGVAVHPNDGFDATILFAHAEESGLIIAMGEWILREACREVASWPRRLQISVNLSPIQFRNGDLPKFVHSVLLETGLAPGRLELEVTEGVLIDDFSRAVAV